MREIWNWGVKTEDWHSHSPKNHERSRSNQNGRSIFAIKLIEINPSQADLEKYRFLNEGFCCVSLFCGRAETSLYEAKCAFTLTQDFLYLKLDRSVLGLKAAQLNVQSMDRVSQDFDLLLLFLDLLLENQGRPTACEQIAKCTDHQYCSPYYPHVPLTIIHGSRR